MFDEVFIDSMIKIFNGDEVEREKYKLSILDSMAVLQEKAEKANNKIQSDLILMQENGLYTGDKEYWCYENE